MSLIMHWSLSVMNLSFNSPLGICWICFWDSERLPISLLIHLASIRAVRVSVSKQWLIGEHLHVTSEGIHVVSTAAIKAVERAMEKNNFIVKSSICQIIWVSWSFFGYQRNWIIVRGKAGKYYSVWYFCMLHKYSFLILTWFNLW